MLKIVLENKPQFSLNEKFIVTFKYLCISKLLKSTLSTVYIPRGPKKVYDRVFSLNKVIN